MVEPMRGEEGDTTASAILLVSFKSFSSSGPVMGTSPLKLFCRSRMVSTFPVKISLSPPWRRTLGATAVMLFVFPEEFNLTHLRMAGSPQINGGFDIVVSGRTVRIKRSGLGNEISPDTDISLLFGNIKNPSMAGVFSIESWVEKSPDRRSSSVFCDVNIIED